MVIPDAQLPLGADHAFGNNTPDPGGLQGLQITTVGIEKLRTDSGERDLLLLRHVGRPAHHLDLNAAGVHCTQSQAVGVGVGVHFSHVAHVAVLPAADGSDLRHLGAGHGQTMGQLFHRHHDVHVLFKPGQRDFHALSLKVTNPHRPCDRILRTFVKLPVSSDEVIAVSSCEG